MPELTQESIDALIAAVSKMETERTTYFAADLAASKVADAAETAAVRVANAADLAATRVADAAEKAARHVADAAAIVVSTGMRMQMRREWGLALMLLGVLIGILVGRRLR